ncbi:MAG: TonB-dependent receptor plug domain-containing protein [Leptospiraceae bacterium]|nr:TonB-dependent receptor plug domain-containing protein [Leptospiraceae bacterium]
MLLYGILLLFTTVSLFSQENNQNLEKSILLANFSNHKSNKEDSLESELLKNLKLNLEKAGFKVTNSNSENLIENLNNSKKQNFSHLVHGYYRRSASGNLNLYGIVYNPETGYAIDSIAINDDLAGIEGIKLDPNEMKVSDSQRIKDFVNKFANKIRANPKRFERRENLNEALVDSGFIKERPEIRLSKEDVSKASEEVFKLISEKDDVVVSVSKFAQKTSEAPADITVISREQIRRHGFRNLSESLNLVPQVYSHWVGQNWGTDFRGLFVNNQIERRVLYLQDGKKLNDYFHFGEFYADVFTDMERIEKIEVIKGPGAALYGNNSITGVVNVITRKPKKKNEMEFMTEYDSVLRTVTGRALYYSKFSDKFSVSLDVSKFEGKGFYDSGYNSWGSTRYYDVRTGSTLGTSEFGRETSEIHTGQRIWWNTGGAASNGSAFPNFNLDVKYGDFNFKSFYMSKRTSWVPPQFDGSPFGGDTVYGSPRNDRIWGVGAMMLDYTPSYLEKYEASFRLFRQLNINSDYRDKDFQGFSQNAAPPELANPGSNYGVNSAARLTSPTYLNYVRAGGGGFVKRYASTAWAQGGEFQLTPYKIENNKDAILRNFRFMIGGNAQAVSYINYQGLEARNDKWNRRVGIQGIGDDGRQFGLWNQISTTFKTDTTLVFGLRYDAQKVYNVYRHQNGIENDIAYENVTDPIQKTPVAPTGAQPNTGAGNPTNVSTPQRDQFGNVIANGYVQPFQRKDFVAEDKTPRIAFIQNFPSTNTTIKLMYAEAFRMVTPQELIRLPRELGNAQSEKVINREINLIQGFLKNSLIFNLSYFRMAGNTIYAFNASTVAFGQTPGWTNQGGSLSTTYNLNKDWRVQGSFTSYELRRASDVSFLNTLFTPKPQALNSPTKLWKAAISRSLFNDQYSITLEYYYNSAIYLMENPPTDLQQTRGSNGEYREVQPLNQERTNASTYFGTGVGGGITRYRIWKVPPSQFFNLTFSSNVGNDLILVISAKNIFNQTVYYPLDIESGSFTSPTQTPYQLLGFGREVFLKLGYRF